MAIALLSLFYITGDWVSYAYIRAGSSPAPAFAIAVAAAKYLASWLSCLFVWSIGNDRLDERDAFWLRAAFSFLVAADTFMVLLFPVLAALGRSPSEAFNAAGIICFMAVQTCLIVRHWRNARSAYRGPGRGEAGRKRALAKLAVTELFMVLIVAIPVTASYYLAARKPTPIMVVYGVYLVISLAVAWSALRRSFFPRRNAWMIALGMTSFFLCDVNVGLSGLSPVATPLVWTFYTPALILLAASGIDYRKRA